MISERAAGQLHLTPVGEKRILTPAGVMSSNRYLVDIQLPNNYRFLSSEVSSTKIEAPGVGLIIGMDIISRGDLAITNYDGKTVFTFRIPSYESIDFEEGWEPTEELMD